jgi:transcription-repair coupling factor (superfamily II helicase)
LELFSLPSQAEFSYSPKSPQILKTVISRQTYNDPCERIQKIIHDLQQQLTYQIHSSQKAHETTIALDIPLHQEDYYPQIMVQAYAYFLYHTQKLQEDAKKRLRAIVEACELGSGFQVAMRDLEIRGAGEILGSSQSGTMQTVGVSHYLRMLKQAVEDLRHGSKGDVAAEEAPVEIQLPVEAFIPAFYITESEEKISVYQKLAGSEDEAILKEFETDLREEYGELPVQVMNLLSVLRLRMACRRAGVQRIKMEDGKDRFVVLTLSPRVTAKEIMQLLSHNPQWKISGSTLRMSEQVLLQKAKGKDWVLHLASEVAHLEKKK